MKIVISESQYRSMVKEASRKKFNIDLSNMKKFAEETVGKIQDELKLQFRMLFTWGAAVGGVMGPLNGFIENGNFDMSSYEKVLILVATCAILFHENKKSISKLFSIIEKNNLTDIFKIVLSKGEELKTAFIDFIRSLNVTLYTITNIMSYTFLIPLLPMLWEIAHGNVELDDIREIAARLLAFGLTSVTGVTLKKIISKILERFK